MKYIKRTLVVLLIITVLPVLILRWVNPPTTSFMLQHSLKALWSSRNHKRVSHRWENWKDISRYAPLAVVAAEDQKFPHHWGFDSESIALAWEERRKGIRYRGASTITQQVAKNLFLWPGGGFIRKGVEAYFTVLIELSWSKRRILEVYLNVAEFGNGVYGVGAASRRYFQKSPRYLRRGECALLAAVLPNPKQMRLDRPSSYMHRRATRIIFEMTRLESIGKKAYLYKLYKKQ